MGTDQTWGCLMTLGTHISKGTIGALFEKTQDIVFFFFFKSLFAEYVEFSSWTYINSMNYNEIIAKKYDRFQEFFQP